MKGILLITVAFSLAWAGVIVRHHDRTLTLLDAVKKSDVASLSRPLTLEDAVRREPDRK